MIATLRVAFHDAERRATIQYLNQRIDTFVASGIGYAFKHSARLCE